MIRTNHFSTDHWADWMMMHRKTIAIACACLVVALIGGVWAMQASNSRKIKDFETADILADELQKAPKIFDSNHFDLQGNAQSTNQTLASLKALDDKYTILQPRFDSLIAQEMLLQDNDKELDPYAKRSIQRLRALGLTDFADYSEVSRLAGLQQYKEALELATQLKARLTNQYLLQGFLLLHIATINQKLGNHEAMLQTLVELKEYLGLTKRKTPLTAEEKELAGQMLAHLQDRQSSLLEFIEGTP